MTETQVRSLAEITAQIAEDVWEAKRRKIERRPRHVLSAHDVDDRCNRYLWYSIAHWKDRKLHDAGSQAVFDQADWEAEASQVDLREGGYKLLNQETAYEIKTRNGHVITGHCDWFLTKGCLGDEKIPCEHKGLSYGQERKWETWRDMLKSRRRWIARYPGQLQMYLLQSDSPRGLFIIRGKESGALTLLPMELEFDFCERILQKAEAVYDALDAEEPPERVPFDPDLCDGCDFAHLCEPEQHVQIDEGGIVFDEEREADVARYFELQEAAKEHGDVGKRLKAWAKAINRPSLVVGSGVVTVTEQERNYKAQPAKEAHTKTTQVVKIRPREEAS